MLQTRLVCAATKACLHFLESLKARQQRLCCRAKKPYLRPAVHFTVPKPAPKRPRDPVFVPLRAAGTRVANVKKNYRNADAAKEKRHSASVVFLAECRQKILVSGKNIATGKFAYHWLHSKILEMA